MAAVSTTAWLKPLRWPRAWLALWGLAILVVVVVCLMPMPAMPPLPDNSDKIEHLLAYFFLAALAVQLFASRRALWIVAIALVAMGIGIEIAQGALTEYRSADPQDALANTVGVLLGMATLFTPWRNLLQRFEKRLPL
jgi:VanZ family protein